MFLHSHEAFDRLHGRLPEANKMPYCPECGGEMRYDQPLKRYICKSCGLSLTYQELMELRDRNRETPESGTEEEKRRKRRKEYLDWWFARRE